MTEGQSLTEGPNATEVPAWTDGLQLADGSNQKDGFGFVKNWKVATMNGLGVGMPKDQTFMIKEIVEPGRRYFQIQATSKDPEIHLDWTQAELTLEDGKLKHCFEAIDAEWVISLEQDGTRLHATGKHSCSTLELLEEPGEWEANEETGP